MGVMKYRDPDTGEWVTVKIGGTSSDGTSIDLSNYTPYEYVDTQDNETLDNAKSYTDEKISAIDCPPYEYVDTQDNGVLDDAKAYTNTQIEAIDFSPYVTTDQLDARSNSIKNYVNTMIADIDFSPYAKTEDIPTAVESTLTEAKESGEFDGADGYTPVKGIDYWTEEDKAEVVANVLAALPAAEGVAF